MTRRTVPVAALTAAALVLLAACGGGGGDSDTIRGAGPAPSAAVPSASGLMTPTTPSASATGVRRPVIILAAGTRNTFTPTHTGDPVKDAVLADEANATNAVDAAITSGKNHTPAMEFYITGVALSGAVQFVQGYLDKDDTWVGVTHYIDRKVTLEGKNTAVVISCSDETQSFIKHRKTGKLVRTPASADDYVLYNERLEKSPAGVWVVASTLSKRGAKECQP